MQDWVKCGDTAALLVKKSTLARGFSNAGKLIAPVEFLLVGDASVCKAVFQLNELHAAILASLRITLQPEC